MPNNNPFLDIVKPASSVSTEEENPFAGIIGSKPIVDENGEENPFSKLSINKDKKETPEQDTPPSFFEKALSAANAATAPLKGIATGTVGLASSVMKGWQAFDENFTDNVIRGVAELKKASKFALPDEEKKIDEKTESFIKNRHDVEKSLKKEFKQKDLKDYANILEAALPEGWEKDVEKASGGALLPKNLKDTPRWVNTWATILGTQIPNMATAAATGGVGSGVIYSLQARDQYTEQAENLGIPKKNYEEYADLAGASVGVSESIDNILLVGPLKKLKKKFPAWDKMKGKIFQKALKEAGIIGFEGGIESFQDWANKAFLVKAARDAGWSDEEIKEKIPDVDPRSFFIGGGVAGIVRGAGHGGRLLNSRKTARAELRANKAKEPADGVISGETAKTGQNDTQIGSKGTLNAFERDNTKNITDTTPETADTKDQKAKPTGENTVLIGEKFEIGDTEAWVDHVNPETGDYVVKSDDGSQDGQYYFEDFKEKTGLDVIERDVTDIVKVELGEEFEHDGDMVFAESVDPETGAVVMANEDGKTVNVFPSVDEFRNVTGHDLVSERPKLKAGVAVPVERANINERWKITVGDRSADRTSLTDLANRLIERDKARDKPPRSFEDAYDDVYDTAMERVTNQPSLPHYNEHINRIHSGENVNDDSIKHYHLHGDELAFVYAWTDSKGNQKTLIGKGDLPNFAAFNDTHGVGHDATNELNKMYQKSMHDFVENSPLIKRAKTDTEKAQAFNETLKEFKETMKGVVVDLPNGASVHLGLNIGIGENPQSAENALTAIGKDIGRNTINIDNGTKELYNLDNTQGTDLTVEYKEAGLTSTKLEARYNEYLKNKKESDNVQGRGVQSDTEPGTSVSAFEGTDTEKKSGEVEQQERRQDELVRDLSKKIFNEGKIRGNQWAYVTGKKNRDKNGNLVTLTDDTRKHLNKIVKSIQESPEAQIEYQEAGMDVPEHSDDIIRILSDIDRSVKPERKKGKLPTKKKKVARPAKKNTENIEEDTAEDFPESTSDNILDNQEGSIKLGNSNEAPGKYTPNDITAFLKKNFTPESNLPGKTFKSMIERDGWVASESKRVEQTLFDFNGAKRSVYGNKGPTRKEIFALDQVLKGKKPESTIPDGMRDVVSQMRHEIDALSQKLIDSGIIEGELVGQITENMGHYATRAYRVFSDPKWANKVPKDVRNKAKALLRSEFPNSTEEEIEGLIEELLFKNGTPINVLASGGKLGSKNLSILKKRKFIPKEIRALWGEYKEADVNYALSVSKMAHLVANHNFLNKVRSDGLGKFLHKKPIKNKDGNFSVQIATEGSKTFAPLNGLYTTKEIAEAFNALTSENLAPWMRHWMKINGLVKWSKTVGSIMTHVRNTTGNVGFAVANGHFDVKQSAEAIGAILNDITNSGTSEKKAFVRKMYKLGLLDESITFGELRDTMRDAQGRGIDAIVGSKTGGLIKGAVKLTNKLYAVEDGLWKIYAWKNERNRYAKAMPELNESELDQLAADIVRNTYPTYSLIPKAIKALRRFPVVGTFVSFPAEVVRVGFNTVGLAMKELADPRLRAIGAQRLVGIMVAATGTAAVGVATRALLGITKDKEEAIKEFIPPWSKNSDISWLGNGGNGQYKYIDVGFSDPYAYLKKPVMAAINGGDWKESIVDASMAALEPFISQEILLKRVSEAKANKKENGSQVYNEQDSGDKIAKDIALHVWGALEPGSASSIRRIVMGIRKESKNGMIYDPKVEAAATLTGLRMSQVDISRSFGFKARKFSKDLTEATKSGEGRDDIDAKIKSKKRLMEKFKKTFEAGVIAGVSSNKLRKVMKDSNIPNKAIKAIVSGNMDLFLKTDAAKMLLKEKKRKLRFGISK